MLWIFYIHVVVFFQTLYFMVVMNAFYLDVLFDFDELMNVTDYMCI